MAVRFTGSTLLKSTEVRVFPCAYRNANIDAKARLNLEENFKSLGANGLGKRGDGSYIISIKESGEDYIYKLFLGGYYFELTTSQITDKYIYILTDVKDSYRILAPLDGTTLGDILDVSGDFVGLATINDISTVTPGVNEELHYVKLFEDDQEAGRLVSYEDYLPEIQHDIAQNALTAGSVTLSGFLKASTIYAQNLYVLDSTVPLQIGSQSDPGTPSVKVLADNIIEVGAGSNISLSAPAIIADGTLNTLGIYPFNSGSYDIGASDNSYRSAYISSIYASNGSFTSNIDASKITLYGNIVPSANNKHSIGAAAKKFNGAYIETINTQKLTSTDTIDINATTELNLTAGKLDTEGFAYIGANYIRIYGAGPYSGSASMATLDLEASQIGIGSKSGNTLICPNSQDAVTLGTDSYPFRSLYTKYNYFDIIYGRNNGSLTFNVPAGISISGITSAYNRWDFYGPIGNSTTINSSFIRATFGTDMPYIRTLYYWYSASGQLSRTGTCLSMSGSEAIFNAEVLTVAAKPSVYGITTVGKLVLNATQEIDSSTSYVTGGSIYIGSTIGAFYGTADIYLSASKNIIMTASNYSLNLTANYINLKAPAARTKLTTNDVGNSSKPMYLNAGTPTACNFTVAASKITSYKAGIDNHPDDDKDLTPINIDPNRFETWNSVMYIIGTKTGKSVTISITNYDNPAEDKWIRFDLSQILYSLGFTASADQANSNIDANSVSCVITTRKNVAHYYNAEFMYYHDTGSSYKKYLYVCKDGAGGYGSTQGCTGFTVLVTLWLTDLA